MRNYNNHTQMNSVDKAMTDISEGKVIKLKTLARHDFLRDKTGMTLKSLNAGGAVRICMETIMACYYLEDWKSFKKNMSFFDANATDYQIATLERELDRLYEVTGEEDRKLFKSSMTFLYLTLFHRFTNYDIDDDRFIEFLHMFDDRLHSEHVDGDSFDEIVKLGGTKGKGVIERKLRILTDLMENYLGISEECDEYDEDDDAVEVVAMEDAEDSTELGTVIHDYTNYLLDSSYYDYISKGNYSYNDCYKLAYDIVDCIKCTNETLLEYYTEMLDEYLDDDKRENNDLISVGNTPALIGMIKYFDDENIATEDIEKWFSTYSLIYTSSSDRFVGKDSKYILNEFLNNWRNARELETNKGVA